MQDHTLIRLYEHLYDAEFEEIEWYLPISYNLRLVAKQQMNPKIFSEEFNPSALSKKYESYTFNSHMTNRFQMPCYVKDKK